MAHKPDMQQTLYTVNEQNSPNTKLHRMALTRAFCLGVERQQITDAQLIASSKNDFSSFLSRANDNDLPSMIKPNDAVISLLELICDIPSLICFVMLSCET